MSKDDILLSFIGEQKKLHDFHGTLVKNLLEDKAAQMEGEEDVSSSESSFSSDDSSDFDDEMEGKDSVLIADQGA